MLRYKIGTLDRKERKEIQQIKRSAGKGDESAGFGFLPY
jgi:hypothetical protein